MTQKDNSSKWRVVLAIVISFIIIVGFNIFFMPKTEESKPQTQQQQQPQNQTAQTELKSTQNTVSAFKDAEKKQPDIKTDLKNDPKNQVKTQAQVKLEKVIAKQTELYDMEFSTKGAVLKSLKFKKYLDKEKKPIELTPLIEKESAPFLYALKNIDLGPDYDVVDTKDGNLTFVQEDANLKIEKQYVFNSNTFDIKVNVTLTNKTQKELATQDIFKWGKSAGPFIPSEKQSSYDQEINVSYYDRNNKAEERFSGETVERNIDTDWIGLDNRYFFIAIMPETAGKYQFRLQNEKPLYDEEIALATPVQIAPKASLKKSYTVYIGPKDERILKTYGRNLEAITDRGFAPITLIGKGIKFLLFWINGLVVNFGITIILLSLIFKILLHPLSKKSMESARKMQVLGPQIEAIKKKYGDNKQEMNQKIWEMYKREKINPASGCLPLLLQMPFFFALYSVLPYVVELKNVSFLWIHDFSSPDTIFYIESFKHIPLFPYQFNILPILLTIFSFIQTKVSQGGNVATSQGKIMEYLMPIMFLFIFWTMPSGLVLYWLMQTIFTIIHQYYVNKRPPKNKKGEEQGKNKKKLTKKTA